MSAQLSNTLKDAKLSYKAVLELLYQKDPDLVGRLINEVAEAKPVKTSKTVKPLTQQEKDERKQSRDAKKLYRTKLIARLGGEDAVTEKQIKEEMKKYDKDKNNRTTVEQKPEQEPVSEPDSAPEPEPESEQDSEPESESEPEQDPPKKSETKKSETKKPETKKPETKPKKKSVITRTPETDSD